MILRLLICCLLPLPIFAQDITGIWTGTLTTENALVRYELSISENKNGLSGYSLSIFTKNKKGDYQLNLGFPGMMPEFQKTFNLGYPDLLIGSPGFEQPVWRWNGKDYQFYKKVRM